MNLPENQPTQPPISRQMMRQKLFELTFQDISKKYYEPRKSRRKLSRGLAKKSWEVYRNSNVDK